MRLTTDKSVSEMNMTELAYNSCYSNNGNATFRDYEKITDARHMIRNIFIKKNIAMPCDFWDNDEAFDEIMLDNLQYGLDNDIGIISLLYLQIWTKADMREVLKRYEDLEEQGLLVKLPCQVGDAVYRPVPKTYRTYTKSTVTEISITEEGISFNTDKGTDWRIDTIGRTIFLTQEEAEQVLKEHTKLN